MHQDVEPTMKPEPAPIHLHNPFPTSVVTKQWEGTEELNDALRLAIYRQRIKDPAGVYRSNSAGTHHTDDKILTWAGAAGKQLAEMYTVMFRALADQWGGKAGGAYELKMQAWAMVYGDRGYATAHTHPNCHMSAVYYPVVPACDKQLTMATGVRIRPGDLEFTDTRGHGNVLIPGLVLQPSWRLTPKTGMMVAFPSWMPHFVHPMNGPEERISIACNGTISKYTQPKDKEPD